MLTCKYFWLNIMGRRFTGLSSSHYGCLGTSLLDVWQRSEHGGPSSHCYVYLCWERSALVLALSVSATHSQTVDLHLCLPILITLDPATLLGLNSTFFDSSICTSSISYRTTWSCQLGTHCQWLASSSYLLAGNGEDMWLIMQRQGH